MKIETIEVYGSAGGTRRIGDIHAHVTLSECDTVAAAKALLGAAPDLLDALKAARDYIMDDIGQSGARMDYADTNALEAINAAIAKAETP